MICPHCKRKIKSAADELREARKRAGLSQAEAARRCGIERQKMNAYERGRSTPRPRRMAEMLNAIRTPAG